MKNSKFIDKFAAFAGRLGNQIHLKTLRDAFATVMPLYILAGFNCSFEQQQYLSGFSKEIH